MCGSGVGAGVGGCLCLFFYISVYLSLFLWFSHSFVFLYSFFLHVFLSFYMSACPFLSLCLCKFFASVVIFDVHSSVFVCAFLDDCSSMFLSLYLSLCLPLGKSLEGCKKFTKS